MAKKKKKSKVKLNTPNNENNKKIETTFLDQNLKNDTEEIKGKSLDKKEFKLSNKYSLFSVIENGFNKREYKKGIVFMLLANFAHAILICSIIYRLLNKDSFSFYRLTFSNASKLAFNVFLVFNTFIFIYILSLYVLSKKLKFNLRVERFISSISSINVYVLPILVISIIIYNLFNIYPIVALIAIFSIFNTSLFYISNKLSIENIEQKLSIITISYAISIFLCIVEIVLIFKDFIRIFEIIL